MKKKKNITKDCYQIKVVPIKSRRQWQLEISQNGGEYYGWVLITASEVMRTGQKSVLADDVIVEFDEKIESIRLKTAK